MIVKNLALFFYIGNLLSITVSYRACFCMVPAVESDHEIYRTNNKHGKNIVLSNIISVLSNNICVYKTLLGIRKTPSSSVHFTSI